VNKQLTPGQRVRTIRKLLKLSLRELAPQIGISYASLSNVESDTRILTVEELAGLEATLHAVVDQHVAHELTALKAALNLSAGKGAR
jgi:transcriptional regulator with XRE-family HTH domain